MHTMRKCKNKNCQTQAKATIILKKGHEQVWNTFKK